MSMSITMCRGKGDAPAGVLAVGGLADRRLWFRVWLRVGARFEVDRGAQLIDRGVGGKLRVVLIRARARPFGDHPDLIERQPALPQAGDAAGEFRHPVGDGGDGLAVLRRRPSLPRHQRRHRPGTGDAAQAVVLDLGGDLHDAPIDRVALTRQLRQLVEQHLEPRSARRAGDERRCARRHDPILAAGYDKSRPRASQPRELFAHHRNSSRSPASTMAFQDLDCVRWRDPLYLSRDLR